MNQVKSTSFYLNFLHSIGFIIEDLYSNSITSVIAYECNRRSSRNKEEFELNILPFRMRDNNLILFNYTFDAWESQGPIVIIGNKYRNNRHTLQVLGKGNLELTANLFCLPLDKKYQREFKEKGEHYKLLNNIWVPKKSSC